MNRLRILLAILMVWSLVVVARLSQLMLFPRETVRKATSDAWVPVTIPGMRGCILDRNGRYLAWSERYFALYWKVAPESARAAEELELLRGSLPAASLPAAEALPAQLGRELLISNNLAPRDMAILPVLQTEVAGLRLQSYFQRRYYPDRTIRRLLGEVLIMNGEEVGVSGEEKKQDELLRGRPGRFRVMANRDGTWVKNTWTKVMDMSPGYDVYLPISITTSIPGKQR